MCGICGYFGKPLEEPQSFLNKLNSALIHRGPDDEGIWYSADKSIGLGHRRLAIVDLSSSGKQPMLSASGRYKVVFNGEIYNYKDLRGELISYGHQFRSQSDTEVLLASFEQWGVKEAVKHLNGMFAVATFDQQEQVLYIFRDRIGVKPLYYKWHGNTLYFSSELTVPFSKLGDRRIDPNALALYFRHNYIPAPYTIYQGMRKLVPGRIAMITKKSAIESKFASDEAYWSTQNRINEIIPERDRTIGVDQAVDMVEYALRNSVKARMIADVPVGAFLSGGIDSSLVVSHMQELSSERIQTYTIGFSDQNCDEAVHAKLVAQHLGTEHTELHVTEADALNVIPKLPTMYGEPFADSSQIPTYLVSKLTRNAITVALSGDGGDELFAGYRNYQRIAEIQRYLSLIPPSLYVGIAHFFGFRTIQQMLCYSYGEQRFDWIFRILRLFAREKESKIPQGIHSQFSLSERLVLGIDSGASEIPFYRCQGNITEQMMCDNLMVYHPDDILAKVDRASMAVSLEVRVPFIDDFEVFDAAWRIPFDHKLNQKGGKMVLKKALARHLPTAIFERPKMGFGVPLARWLNGPLKEWVDACVDPLRIHQEGFLDPTVVKRLASMRDKENDWYAYKLWAVCIFQAWLEKFHYGESS